ncbi:hypothetical protein HPB51_019637 [Rhipicephalus microplus]|uniref:Flavin-containing monooxygenase n=1 Tax=Rhipicephalus microplus TaxID=6941 RepID=A0A9J6EBD5_RHIMP|nr:hypothetical protein HPB51_019637 [Rhipicephalus microplus]
MSTKKVCVVGAGPSGLACARQMLDYGFDVVLYERSAELGGLWVYHDDDVEGRASVMRTTVINTSKEMSAFSFKATRTRHQFFEASEIRIHSQRRAEYASGAGAKARFSWLQAQQALSFVYGPFCVPNNGDCSPAGQASSPRGLAKESTASPYLLLQAVVTHFHPHPLGVAGEIAIAFARRVPAFRNQPPWRQSGLAKFFFYCIVAGTHTMRTGLRDNL